MEILRTYDWPGNVRELRHCLHRAAIFSRGHAIQPEDISRALRPHTESLPAVRPDGQSGLDAGLRKIIDEYLRTQVASAKHQEFMETVDRILVQEALRIAKGNESHAAQLLGLSRRWVVAKIHRHGLERDISFRG
jgi:DNA-binding NtrC family response regulator